MWTFECESLGIPRLWLRPGKKYLLGRTGGNRRKGEFKLDEKSVSRKHITLEVAVFKAGSGSQAHNRSELTLKDEDTKFGTEVDGLKVERGEKRILQNDEHTFKLGKTEHIFRVIWHPVVLTFSFSSKETRDGKDPLADIRRKLEPLDVRTLIPYIPGTTTHVVQGKRNTAKGLQALVNAKYIVTPAYVDAILEATTIGDPLNDESFSLLEADYDKNWPDPSKYLPAKSKEPNERPAEFFAPNPQRANIFEGYTFVFCDQIQFETLLQPITNAGGKAFKFTLKLGQTRCTEIVRFVKELAGEKSMGEFEDESIGKGPVVVRFRGGGKEYEDWAIGLGDEIAISLGQRLIEQSEFMDAILMNDPSMLRKPLQIDDEPATTTHGANGAASQSEQAQLSKPEVSQPPRRVRGPVKSRFKGFDDEFDISAIPPAPRNLSVGSHTESGRAKGVSQYNTQHAPDAESQMDIDVDESGAQQTQSLNPRKRPAPEVLDQEEFMDNLLPAAAAVKRRRLEEQKEAERTGKPVKGPFKKQPPKATPPTKEAKKEVNIKDAVRERREAEDQAARQNEQSLQDTIDDMDIEAMKNLAVIEEMDIPARADRPSRRPESGPTSDRWDDRWNGRKNFKKFRRQGERTQARRGHTVIVPLEPVKQKDYGIGEEYWLDSSEKTKKKRKNKTQPQTQALSNAKLQPVEEVIVEDEEPSELHVPAELASNLNDDTPETIDVDAPRVTRGREHTQQNSESSTLSHTAASAGTKRKAPLRERAAPAKKAKVISVQDSDDSDSGDDMKFRFRKRR